MIKKNLKMLLITSAVILLPALAGVVLWNRLPDQIPTHWNFAGEVDGWSSKPFGVFGLALILLALHWVCALATAADPKGEGHSGKVLQLIFWLLPIMSVVLHTFIYAAALGRQVRIEVMVPVLLGLLFTIIGNYLPKCRQNYTIGIKIPWTLNSEENWNRTHRLAGVLWVVCGLVIMLAGFFGGMQFFLPIALLMAFVPMIYSYILYRKGI